MSQLNDFRVAALATDGFEETELGSWWLRSRMLEPWASLSWRV